MKSKRGNVRGKIIRFGVIGVGGMGTGHCIQIGPVQQARLTAVCDIDPAIAKRVGKQFNVPYFPTHRQLIRSGL